MKTSGINETLLNSSLYSIEKNNKADISIKQLTAKKNISQKSLLNITNKYIFTRLIKKPLGNKSCLKLKTFATKNSLTNNLNPIQEEQTHMSFDLNTKIDSQKMTSKLLTHWTGKDENYLEKNKKIITKLNSSAMLAFSTLIKEGTTLTTSPLPNCLISSKATSSKFEIHVQELLKDVVKLNPSLENKIKNSPGLFKTPILISHKIKYDVQAPEDIEDIHIPEKKITSTIKYYPQIDTKNTASNSVTTIYLPSLKSKNRNNLIQGLEQALNKAVDRAEYLIPTESKETAKNYLIS